MTSIYTTKENLTSICLDDDKQPWLDIIIKLKEVYVNDDDIFSEVIDTDNDLFFTLDGMQIDINTSKKDFINAIPNNPVIVLQQPSGIFLLDISNEAANQIQKDYGVICQSISNLDHNPLTQAHIPTELLDGEVDKTWDLMIARYKDLPSNSALVIDAHLFDEDRFDENNKCYDERKRDGIENAYAILNSILPHTFRDTYHIGVFVTDTDKAKTARRSRTNLTNDRIATAINKLKKELKRDYPIDIYVVFFDLNDDGHKLIHNRRILSNYFIITAEYKLAAFKKGRSSCSQSIGTFSLFEGIDKYPDTDKKEKRVRNEIRLFLDFFNRQPNSHTALLYYNGKKIDDFSQFNHRFLY